MSGLVAKTVASSEKPKKTPLLCAYENAADAPLSPACRSVPALRPKGPRETASSVPTATCALEEKASTAAAVVRIRITSVNSAPAWQEKREKRREESEEKKREEKKREEKRED